MPIPLIRQVGAGLAGLILAGTASACTGPSSPGPASSPASSPAAGTASTPVGSASAPGSAGRSSAAAAPGAAVTTEPVAAAAGWLVTQFENGKHLPAPDGDHFDEKYGSTVYPDYGAEADVIFGLAAAKVGAAKIATALSYLRRHVAAYAGFGDPHGPYDGSIGKLALAAVVAGADPRHFAGHDLIGQLARDECPAGASKCTPGSAANIYSSISESFVLLAEARAGHQPTPRAVAYLLSLQCPAGGFPDGVKPCTGAADDDATAYAIMALQAAGGHRSAVRRASRWLAGERTTGGYWVSQHRPNVNTTGLAAAALAGAGQDLSATRRWLLAQQVPAGSPGAGAFRYGGKIVPTTTSATSPSVLATAQAIPALVPDGSLATLTASGAAAGAPVFPPTVTTAGTIHAGSVAHVTGVGFAAGERVELSLAPDARPVAGATADALGTVRFAAAVPDSTAGGSHDLTLTGVSSGLTAQHAVTVTR
ncbi:MAG TPA: hypothetical protein VFH38_10925 [Jatrophihabitans sp.]|nr:hypothetical protein [Jatrophihabitans sp.]